MASMIEITCKCGCGRKKMVRTADVARGWGKYYSKSCKAKAQERRTGQHAARLRKAGGHREDLEGGVSGYPFSNEEYFSGYGFGEKD